MRFVLSALILLLVVCHILSLDLSLAPGLSAKNGMLYLAASFIAFRFAVQGRFKLEMGGLIGCYLALIGYALATWLVAGLFVEYKSYSMLQSFISLKNNLIDPLIFFLTFFYGVRNSEDAIKILKVILVGGGLMHLANLSTAFNFYSFGDWVEPGTNGRMTGPLGEANTYGDFIAMFLPPLIAAMSLSRGVARLMWLTIILLSLACLLTTASRAAIVAIVLSGIIGAHMVRRYLSAEKIAPFLIKALALAAIVFIAVSIEFGSLLYSRFVSESQAAGVANLSSGRTEFWAEMLGRMMSAPVSLLTGFGWNSYSIMGFLYESHNYYLSLWFNIGLPGLFLATATFVILLRTANRAIGAADPRYQPYLIAFVFTILATMVALFFGELFTPWPYFWSYAGLIMKIAVETQNNAAALPASRPSRALQTA